MPTPTRMAGIVLALLVAGYLVAWPAFELAWSHWHPKPQGGEVLDLSVGERARIRTTEFIVALFFVTLGATFGSYLNVVVHRLPLGRSVVSEPSRCPRCKTAIKARDNIPIVGWWLLNGRCRACQEPISARYPIVEALIAGLFLSLYFVELLSGGANIPERHPNLYTGVVWIVLYTKWDLLTLYLYHCSILCAVFAWGLMAMDGHRPPLAPAASALSAALIGPLLWPGLTPVESGLSLPVHNSFRARIDEIVNLLIAAGCAAALAIAWWRTQQWRDAADNNADARAVGLGLFVLGIGLGWRALLTTAVLALAVHALLATIASIRGERTVGPLALHLAAAAWMHQLLWRQLAWSLG